MSLKTFFEDIFLKKDSIKSILDCYPDAKEKGFIFERCGDLLIKLGYLPNFSNDKYKHIIGKVNKCKIETLKEAIVNKKKLNPWEYSSYYFYKTNQIT